MSKERVGTCNDCGTTEYHEHRYDCPNYVQPVCPECGCDVDKVGDDMQGCYDHLEGEALYEYARGKVWRVEELEREIKTSKIIINGYIGLTAELQAKLDKVTAEKENWRKAAILNAKENTRLSGVVEALKTESQGRLECVLKQGSVINALKTANEELIALNNKIIAEN